MISALKEFGVDLISKPANADQVLETLDHSIPICVDESCDATAVLHSKVGGLTEALCLCEETVKAVSIIDRLHGRHVGRNRSGSPPRKHCAVDRFRPPQFETVVRKQRSATARFRGTASSNRCQRRHRFQRAVRVEFLVLALRCDANLMLHRRIAYSLKMPRLKVCSALSRFCSTDAIFNYFARHRPVRKIPERSPSLHRFVKFPSRA